MCGAIFASFVFACCCFLHYWRVVILTALQATTVVYFLCCVCSSECTDWFQWWFLVERGTGRNEHGVVVEWISTCVWCLVSTCSSSWYVLYFFVWFSFMFMSHCVTSGCGELNERETTTSSCILKSVLARNIRRVFPYFMSWSHIWWAIKIKIGLLKKRFFRGPILTLLFIFILILYVE